MSVRKIYNVANFSALQKKVDSFRTWPRAPVVTALKQVRSSAAKQVRASRELSQGYSRFVTIHSLLEGAKIGVKCTLREQLQSGNTRVLVYEKKSEKRYVLVARHLERRKKAWGSPGN